MDRTTTYAAAACVALTFGPTGTAFAATINISDLGSQTPTTTFAVGSINDSNYNASSPDADAQVDSTVDATFAFEATTSIKPPVPIAPSSNSAAPPPDSAC